MTVKKWIEYSAEVDVQVGADDIRIALQEAMRNPLRKDPDDNREPPDARELLRALNSVATFFNAITDDMIAVMNPAQRKVISDYLVTAAERFKLVIPK